MRITDTSDMWWKTAVVYCLDVETFLDDDGDGTGDFAGLAQRIDYLAELGVTCLWLMPFFPTNERDDGYDITDFYGVDPRLGTLGHFVEVVRTARDRGMRVIIDLVVNHTSDRHPWFRAARASTDSPYRDYYVWRSDPPPDTKDQVVFPDVEDGIWSLDERTGEWYLHHFYAHQPDLNIANRRVRDEITRAIGFWLELGVSGFRVDAVPFLLDTRGVEKAAAEQMGDPHEFLRELRQFIGRRSGDAVLLGEVNLPYKDQVAYFGGPEGDELTMQFDFVGMQRMYLALAREDAGPLVAALTDRPWVPDESQWGTFVRNHDELTLDKLTDAERQEVFDAFGPQESMQVYGRGLRRRLPPMLDGDPRRIRMVYSLLFSLPGTPVLFYGEEIGMGENLDVPGRMAVRTPMQWTPERHGGFSTARANRLPAPVASGGFAPEFVNVADQRRDPDSLLNFVTTLVQRYRECPELGWGRFEVVEQPYDHVLAHRCTWDDGTLVAAHNFSAEPCTVTLVVDDADPGCRLVGLIGDGDVPLDDHCRAEVSLDGYGYRWFRVVRPGDRRLV